MIEELIGNNIPNETLWQASFIDIIGGFEPATSIGKVRAFVAPMRHITFEELSG